jgi:hypothetical protein
VIPISSQSPALPSHNNLNYELLSLTAIFGEVPCGCSARLTASESYRKKVVTSLTHDKLLRLFSSHHLRGYRLGVRAKRLLLQQEPERFAFYLSGCSDTNAIKSEVPRRIRLHRIAQTYVATDEYRSCKPLIVTTNLTLEQMKNPPDLEHSRIYGRVLEHCAPILFSGKDMRKANAAATKNTARELLASKF